MKRTMMFLLAFAATSTFAASTRTFVSAQFGSDANVVSNCSIALPCRTFAVALSVTSQLGEVVALDSAGYGPVTIDRSVTIIGPPGIYAGITAPPAGTAVTLNLTQYDIVALRGLTLQGESAAGVRGGEGMLSIENCRFLRLSYGVRFEGTGQFQVSGSTFVDNGQGVYATATASAPKGLVVNSNFVGSSGASVHAANGSTIDVSDTSIFDGTVGVLASEGGTIGCTRCTIGKHSTAGAEATAAGSIARLNRCTITRNATGVATFNGGVFESMANNLIHDNTVDVSATKTTFFAY